MVFDGDGLSYDNLKSMDIAEYNECIAAKEIYVKHIKEMTKNKGKGGQNGR